MFRAVALAAATVGLTAGPVAAETIKPARGNWDTGWFHTEIYIEALEALGYDVEKPVTLGDATRYQALAQGDADFSVMEWFPLFNERFDRVNGLKRVGHVVKAGALQGYLVDKATAERLDVTSLADFKRDAVREAFDSDGDGKAEMVACPPGWDCGKVIAHHLKAYDLDRHIDLIQASYSAAMGDAIARYNDGEPILFYTWTPNWTLGVLKPGKDVVWLEVPFASLPDDQSQYEDATTVRGLGSCASDPCNIGWPANDIRPVANTAWLSEHPDIKRLFEVMRIPLDAIFAQNAKMYAGEDSQAAIERHVEAWIDDNRETFDGWIAEARAAAD
jgi:glycine betaine/proline transport system substrate-binding protein